MKRPYIPLLVILLVSGVSPLSHHLQENGITLDKPLNFQVIIDE